MVADVLRNFKEITGRDMVETLAAPGADDAPMFADDVVEQTFPAIETWVYDRYGVNIASSSDFLEALDEAIADATIR